MSEFLQAATDFLNFAGFLLFVALLGAAVFRMGVRLRAYRQLQKQPSVILKRDFGLLGGLFFVYGTLAAIRFFDLVRFIQEPLWGFLFILLSDIIAIGALGYWTWVEFFVIGHDGKEDL